MSYADRITTIRSINAILDQDRRTPEWEGRTVGEIVEDFAHLNECSKMCIFEYLLFRSLGK